MRHGDAAACHHDYLIPQLSLKLVYQATQDDDLLLEVPSFEQIFDRDELFLLFIIVCHARVGTRAKKTLQ